MTEIPKLNPSIVRFDADKHEYWLGEKQLKGITSGSLVGRVKPDKYAGVSEEKLKERAAYGTMIHELIELYEDMGAESDNEDVLHYIKMKKEHGLIHLASEYVVSDGERYASPIDHVFMREDGGIVLVDIKRTYKLDEESVTYQLSIYKRFFEMQNPHLKVVELAAMWLHGYEYAYRVVQPVSEDVIDYLIECDIEDKPFDVTAAFSTLPTVVADVEKEVAKKMREIAERNEEIDELKKGLYDIMEQHGIKSFRGNVITLTRVLPHTSKKFDSAAFKKDYPQTYDEYSKDSHTKGFLKITVNK